MDMFNGSDTPCRAVQALRQRRRNGLHGSSLQNRLGSSRRGRQGRRRDVRSPETATLKHDHEVSAHSSTATLLLKAQQTGEPADSILSLYLRESGQVALLTLADEVRLAARIKRGCAVARDHMIRANLRLVIKIAREYEYLGMPLLDLINEGNIGLMRAVEKFDPAKGGKLSTYASLWIRQQIRRALASQGKTIRLPVHIADTIYRLGQAEVQLRNVLGRDATDEELADELGVKVKKISRLRRAAMRPVSLDAPLGDDASSTVAEVVADESGASPFENLRDATETKLIHKLVDHLPDREANIIRFRFGLDGGAERTLEEVGRRFKLTRERIRQLQNLALTKLRRMLEEPSARPMAA